MNNILTSKKLSSLFFKVCIIRNSTINKSSEFFYIMYTVQIEI